MSQTHRHYSLFDRLIIALDNGVKTLSHRYTTSERQNPAKNIDEETLSNDERKKAARLMRVNHSGEVCAQALYQGQALTAKSLQTREKLEQAGLEEGDHLAWCESRIRELNNHTSYLNPFWYMGSFALGMIAGIAGDRWNLGFIAETEHQVVDHLNNHLKQLPKNDHKSHAILQQMREDENHHAQTAIINGASILPKPIQLSMRITSKLMTYSSYWI